MQMDADPGTSSQRAEELLSMPLQQNEALEVCCAVLHSCLLGALVLPAAGLLQLLAACCWRAVLVYACCQDAAGRQALCNPAHRSLPATQAAPSFLCHHAAGRAAQRPALRAAAQPLAALPL